MGAISEHPVNGNYYRAYLTRCATKNDRIRVPEDTLTLLISERLVVNQD